MLRSVYILTFLMGFIPVMAQLNNLCLPSNSHADLDINNVRTKIFGESTMWWDVSKRLPAYEVPKGSGKNALFAGGLWIGGLDPGGNLKLAAMTYRQTGVDFFPGPLDTLDANTTNESCQEFSGHFKLNRWEVEEFVKRHYQPGYIPPKAIQEWPAHGDVSRGHSYYLAPFHDKDGDGEYNPSKGDYPAFAIDEQQDCNKHLLGDQMIWWIFNDAGNEHSESGADAIGLEVHAQAFAYRTNDDINNTTFYQYMLINRSTSALQQTYAGLFVDVDLGYHLDDYIGCDVGRGMGYGYNGDAIDEGTRGYGKYPPAIGVDLLQGPIADSNDMIDNDRDSLLDETDEQILMSNFITSWGDFTTEHPFDGPDFYNYLRSIWINSTHMTYGSDGYWSGTGINCDFLFPGDSDPYGWGTDGVIMPPWSEETAGMHPWDRKFYMSAGPFSFEPGEVQQITYGTIWARDTTGNDHRSIKALQKADDLAQEMFDNCFDLGCIPPVNEDFIIRHKSEYSEITSYWVELSYPFHGDKFEWDLGDGRIENGNYLTAGYGPGTYEICLTVSNECGKEHICREISIGDTYSSGSPVLTRIEGCGNGGNIIDLSEKTVNQILNSPDHFAPHLEYVRGRAPVQIEVFNTDSLQEGRYTIQLTGTDTVTDGWKMFIQGQNDTVYSDSGIFANYPEQISKWGLRVIVNQSEYPGENPDNGNGFIEATIEYNDPSVQWLSGVEDLDGTNSLNWIRSGTVCWQNHNFNDYPGCSDFYDPNQDYENIIGGTWAPYCLASTNDVRYWNSPKDLSSLASVDIVLTPDKSKWSRCAVMETQLNDSLAEGNAKAYTLRKAPSFQDPEIGFYPDRLKDGTAVDSGMSWFPGYAINVETGERLNIAFGEDSYLVNENGRDMVFNPTSKILDTANGSWTFGGRHMLYVFTAGDTNLPAIIRMPTYDGGTFISTTIRKGISWARHIWNSCIWTSIPLSIENTDWLHNEVRIRIRVEHPLKPFPTSDKPQNNHNPMYNFYIDKEDYIRKPDFPAELLIYPNPFTDYATLIYSENKAATFRLFDLQGKLLREIAFPSGGYYKLDRNDLTQGLYVYVLTAENLKTGGKIFVGPR